MRVRMVQSLALISALLLCAAVTFAQTRTRKPAKHKSEDTSVPGEAVTGDVVGKRITLADGRTMVVDEAWKQGTWSGTRLEA